MSLHAVSRRIAKSSTVELFLDESGSFPSLEDIDPAKRARFPSQVAGFLAPAGGFDELAASAVLKLAFHAASEDLPDVVHGTELIRGLGAWSHITSSRERSVKYNKVIGALAHELRRIGLQPVRLVNSEDIRYPDRVESQVNITAELVTRIADRLSTERAGVLIRIHPARTSVGPGAGAIRREAYGTALKVQTSFALARHGLPLDHWEAEVARIVPAAVSRRLQIADLISHSSHADFSPCGDGAAKEILKEQLNKFDFTLAIPFVLDFVNSCLTAGSIGAAVQALGERLVNRQLSPQLREGARAARARLIDALVGLSASARDSHLNQVLAWIEQLVQQRRDLDLAANVIEWVMNTIEEPLKVQLGGGSAEWFSFGLRTWLLTVMNHSGRLMDGEAVISQMEAMVGRLAGQWEYSSTLLGGLITIAVHESDRRDFAKARARAEAVAEYYGTLAGFFADAMPDVFPKVVKSNLRGKALGTALQAHVLDGDATVAFLSRARVLSDQALAEFRTRDDIARQQQYRSHLEVRVGDFSAARRLLADSLQCASSDHEGILQAIVSLSDEFKGFPLLHWLRIGAEASLAGDIAEARALLDSFADSALRRNPWCTGEIPGFPTHGILRHLATLDAYHKDVSRSLYAVNRLSALENTRQAPALTLIHCATVATVAALLWPVDAARSRSLLFGRGAGGLIRLTEDLQRRMPGWSQIQSVLREWTQILGKITSGDISDDVACDGLLRVARRVVT